MGASIKIISTLFTMFHIVHRPFKRAEFKSRKSYKLLDTTCSTSELIPRGGE
jgi:hypothetical protein